MLSSLNIRKSTASTRSARACETPWWLPEEAAPLRSQSLLTRMGSWVHANLECKLAASAQVYSSGRVSLVTYASCLFTYYSFDRIPATYLRYCTVYSNSPVVVSCMSCPLPIFQQLRSTANAQLGLLVETGTLPFAGRKLSLTVPDGIS